MEQDGYLYAIGLGSSEDWDAGRGSLYCIEDRKGETALPVFTTRERLKGFLHSNFHNPEAHMDMLESIGGANAKPLTEGRFAAMTLDANGVAQAAAMVGANYLIRDPRPGAEQEILRLD